MKKDQDDRIKQSFDWIKIWQSKLSPLLLTTKWTRPDSSTITLIPRDLPPLKRRIAPFKSTLSDRKPPTRFRILEPIFGKDENLRYLEKVEHEKLYL